MRVKRFELTNLGARVVGGSVVDDDHFCPAAVALEELDERVQCLRKSRRFVERRNHYREGDRGIRPLEFPNWNSGKWLAHSSSVGFGAKNRSRKRSTIHDDD